MINLIDHYKNGEKLYDLVVSEVAKKYNLTYMEFSIIMFLNNNPQYDTASEIVTYRHLTKSHVSTSIKSLLEKEYLTSQYHEHDRKTIHLKLTNKTKDIVKDGLVAQENFSKMVSESFTTEEIDLMLRFMKRIDENVNKNLKMKGKKND